MAEEKYIPQKLKLIITIVNRGKGSFYLDLIENMGVNMQMVVEGGGTPNINLSNIWGQANLDRDILFSFVSEDKVKSILKMLDNKFETVRNGDGVAFCVPVSSIIGVSVYQFLVDDRRKRSLKNGK